MTSSSPATPFMAIDRKTTPMDVIEMIQTSRQLAGSEPYCRYFSVDQVVALQSILPKGGEIEKVVATDVSVSALVSYGDATAHIVARSRATDVRVTATTMARADSLSSAIRGLIPDARTRGETVVRIWHHSPDKGGSPTDRPIEAPAWAEIEPNYPMTVRRDVGHLLALVRPRGLGRVVMWHGPPGTGKTTALRALIRAWSPWCQSQYIADPERFFADAGYMTHVVAALPRVFQGPTLQGSAQPETVWRLLIAEDADEHVRKSGPESTASLSRLLNLADGILGQGSNLMILLTSNDETARIHPALLRPGRCLAATEFPAMSGSEASRWLGRPVRDPLTLAELFALRSTGSRPARSTSVGQYL